MATAADSVASPFAGKVAAMLVSASVSNEQVAPATILPIAAQGMPTFGVVSFRRDASGAIVAGEAVAAPNGDIAWRRARAEAFEHGNVGAVVFAAAPTGVEDGRLIASFGEVDLRALTH